MFLICCSASHPFFFSYFNRCPLNSLPLHVHTPDTNATFKSHTSKHTLTNSSTPSNTTFLCLFSQLYLCFYCVSVFIYLFWCLFFAHVRRRWVSRKAPTNKMYSCFVCCCESTSCDVCHCCLLHLRVETLYFVAFMVPADNSVTSAWMFMAVSITVASKIQFSDFIHSSSNNKHWNVYPEEFEPQTSTFILLLLSCICSHSLPSHWWRRAVKTLSPTIPHMCLATGQSNPSSWIWGYKL